MSEPKKLEVSLVQRAANTVSQAKISELVYRSAEDTLVVGDTVIHRTSSGMFCLNDLHKAMGSPRSKRPNEFLNSKAAQETIAHLKDAGEEATYETVIGGANPGTYAHKVLAYEYATALNSAFKVKALVILNLATNAQVEAVQFAYKETVKELGEEKAKRLETVEELQEVYAELEFKQREVDKRVEERDDYRRKLVNYRSPFAKDRREASEKAAIELREINSELNARLEKALTFSGLLGSGLERLRKYIAKEDTRSHKELAEVASKNAKVIEILNDEES